LNDPSKCTTSWIMIVSVFTSGSGQLSLTLPYPAATDVTPLYPFTFFQFGGHSV